MTISITKIIVDLNDKKLELTIEEAKELLKTLKELLDNENTLHYIITTSPMRPLIGDGFNISYGESAPTNGENWTVYHNKLAGKQTGL